MTKPTNVPALARKAAASVNPTQISITRRISPGLLAASRDLDAFMHHVRLDLGHALGQRIAYDLPASEFGLSQVRQYDYLVGATETEVRAEMVVMTRNQYARLLSAVFAAGVESRAGVEVN